MNIRSRSRERNEEIRRRSPPPRRPPFRPNPNPIRRRQSPINRRNDPQPSARERFLKELERKFRQEGQNAPEINDYLRHGNNFNNNMQQQNNFHQQQMVFPNQNMPPVGYHMNEQMMSQQFPNQMMMQQMNPNISMGPFNSMNQMSQYPMQFDTFGNSIAPQMPQMNITIPPQPVPAPVTMQSNFEISPQSNNTESNDAPPPPGTSKETNPLLVKKKV